MIRTVLLACALSIGCYYDDGDDPAPRGDGGQQPAPPAAYTGNYVFSCTDDMYCSGVDPFFKIGGKHCAKDQIEAMDKEKAVCSGKCLCTPHCSSTGEKC